MNSSIVRRLIASFVAITALVLVVSALLNRWSFEHSFRTFLAERDSELLADLAPVLEDHYVSEGGWQRLKSEPRLWLRLIRQARIHSLRDSENREPPPRHPRGRDRLLPRLVLLDSNGNRIAGRGLVSEAASQASLQVDGRRIGRVLLTPLDLRGPGTEARFSGRQTTSTLAIAGIALLIASLGAYLIGRSLRRRVTQLTSGAQAITNGDFDTQLPVTSSDELGELAQRFNALAQTLKANRTARRQWVSDIAHELRTPLTILSGELQALEDGVRPLDKDAIRSLQSEAQRLTVLVSDLRVLALSDEGALTYTMAAVDLNELLEASIRQWQDAASAANLHLTWTAMPNSDQARIVADAERLSQLFNNVLNNSCRHTNAPGQISVALERRGDEMIVLFDDSAPDAPTGSHERIFERLYRADDSRSRHGFDGSGLGLSIAQAIVEGHKGSISASTSPLGGLRIRITLPVDSDQ
ncbi:MAG: ATP-binding protein [Pseudomonadaceae bacterium]|nr:ATP-binding protein [Pseudomonadaceae bacterium]